MSYGVHPASARCASDYPNYRQTKEACSTTYEYDTSCTEKAIITVRDCDGKQSVTEGTVPFKVNL